MILSALRTKIQANWTTGYHSTDLTTAKVNSFINDAQRWVCKGSIILPGILFNHNFSFLKQEVTRSTTTQIQTYSLPVASDSNWAIVPANGTVRRFKAEANSCELINSESYRLPLIKQFKNNLEQKREFRNTLGYGIPSYYCIDGDYLWLYQIPDHSFNSDTAFTINFEFYGYLADLSADDDSNVLTNNFPDVLELKATALGFRFGFDPEKAEYFEGKAKEKLAEMISEDQQRTLTGLEEGMQPDEGQSLNLNT